jgi:hypothetical protein
MPETRARDPMMKRARDPMMKRAALFIASVGAS